MNLTNSSVEKRHRPLIPAQSFALKLHSIHLPKMLQEYDVEKIVAKRTTTGRFNQQKVSIESIASAFIVKYIRFQWNAVRFSIRLNL